MRNLLPILGLVVLVNTANAECPDILGDWAIRYEATYDCGIWVGVGKVEIAPLAYQDGC